MVGNFRSALALLVFLLRGGYHYENSKDMVEQGRVELWLVKSLTKECVADHKKSQITDHKKTSSVNLR